MYLKDEYCCYVYIFIAPLRISSRASAKHLIDQDLCAHCGCRARAQRIIYRQRVLVKFATISLIRDGSKDATNNARDVHMRGI